MMQWWELQTISFLTLSQASHSFPNLCLYSHPLLCFGCCPGMQSAWVTLRKHSLEVLSPGCGYTFQKMVFQLCPLNFMQVTVHFNLWWPSSPTTTNSTPAPGLSQSNPHPTQFLHHAPMGMGYPMHTFDKCVHSAIICFCGWLSK